MGEIEKTLHKIFQPYKGILAADERSSSMDKRLEGYGIDTGERSRNTYRTILFTTPNLERTISGVILSEDTFLHHTINGVPTVDFLDAAGIIPGVKVDGGLEPYKGASESGTPLFITTGIEGLEEKCVSYRSRGARFLKWRSVVPVHGADDSFLETISATAAEYASIAVRNDLVPIIEPEVLLKGDHTAENAGETLERVLTVLLGALRKKKCAARQCILKTSFVTDGLDRPALPSEDVAKKTLMVLKKSGIEKANSFFGVVFLSGGLETQVAIEYIQCIKAVAEQDNTEHSFSVPITFSYARALQDPALREWQGIEANALSAQIVFTQTLQHAIKKYKGMEEPSVAGDGKMSAL